MLKFHLFGTVCQFSDGGDVTLRLDTIGLGDTEIDQEFFFPSLSGCCHLQDLRMWSGKTCAGQSGCKHPRFRYLENILKASVLCFLMSAIMDPWIFTLPPTEHVPNMSFHRLRLVQPYRQNKVSLLPRPYQRRMALMLCSSWCAAGVSQMT